MNSKQWTTAGVISAMIAGLGIPVANWFVSYHEALASEEDLAQVIKRSDSRWKKELLRSRKAELSDVRFKVFELERHFDEDNAAQVRLLSDFKNREADLELEISCITTRGVTCDELEGAQVEDD